MRERLRKHQRKRMIFHGTFDHYIVKADNPKRPYVVFLVRRLRFPDGEKLSDHAWVITKWRTWPEELNRIQKGDWLEFDAEVTSYLKHYVSWQLNPKGDKVKQEKWYKDYGLRNPTFARQPEMKKEPPSNLSESETKALQNELNFLLSVLE